MHMSRMTSKTKSDLVPLLATESHSLNTSSVAIQQQTRRETKSAKTEKCGRIRLMIFIVVFSSLIYLFNFFNYMDEDEFIVSFPIDINWPGPKDQINKNKSKIGYIFNNTKPPPPLPSSINSSVPKGYIVYGPQCKIIDINAHESDAMALFRVQRYSDCSKKKPLTRLINNYTSGEVILHYDNGVRKKFYSIIKSCCYQEIHRVESKNSSADDLWTANTCLTFNKTILLPNTTEFLFVKCKAKSSKSKKPVYVDAHATIRRKENVTERLEQFKDQDTRKPISVLMMGIDSVSRLNLIRAMPRTAQTFYDNGWFELRGYNKIDDNTFPNLMALLTGFNSSYAIEKCDPYILGPLDDCPFIFKRFQQKGYTTALAEDQTDISTFNYRKLGFYKQPTDYYFRPFGMAAEKNLRIKHKSDLMFCLGFKHYVSYIYDYALDFATLYKDEPFFGFFWTNTFTHNALSDASSMDAKIKYYIEELETRGILNNSIVIFFSDHGIRFGPILQLETGWYEERLPFIFIWLPEWFKNEYPELVENLKINRNRLTNPYDLYMTLQHILQLSGRASEINPAYSCPSCQSLFEEVSENRSCSDANITEHWCTCNPFQGISYNDPFVKISAQETVKYINSIVSKRSKKCATLKLKSIIGAWKNDKNDKEIFYRVMFYTSPGNALFEATVKHVLKTNTYEIPSTISRLNMYGGTADCVDSDFLKKYCFCGH